MKNFFALSLVTLALSGTPSPALAAAPKDPGREIIDLKVGTKVLSFNHWKHQTDVKSDCFNCHRTTLGKIDHWDKDTAHKICISCHELEGKGPIQCHECHK